MKLIKILRKGEYDFKYHIKVFMKKIVLLCFLLLVISCMTGTITFASENKATNTNTVTDDNTISDMTWQHY